MVGQTLLPHVHLQREFLAYEGVSTLVLDEGVAARRDEDIYLVWQREMQDSGLYVP